jgi:hypothetical protein
MKPFDGNGSAMWTVMPFMVLLLALMAGPAFPDGIGAGVGAVLYEVTEDMYLLDHNGVPVPTLAHAHRRSAVAQLSGFAKLGTPLCPWEVLTLTPAAKDCTVNASGADDLRLADGRGTLGGTFAVVVKASDMADAPEFVVMTGSFEGAADLSLPFAGVAPVGFLTGGKGCIDVGRHPCKPEKDTAFTFTGTFRLPFTLNARGRRVPPRQNGTAYYLADDFHKILTVRSDERSLGWPTVRLEIKF